ncbi:MAG: transcription-repair coupling factor, partial [Flavobacteriales bacterium]
MLFVTQHNEKVTFIFARRILCLILQPHMELTQFIKSLAKHSAVDRSAAALQMANARLHWKGMVGSAKSLLSLMVAQQVPGTHLFILSDREEAAYFLNDFEGVFPEDKRILFYPASYRVPYQQEQTDNANVVARAEVLEQLSAKQNAWIVTYPEALFEKIPTKKNLVKHTMRLEVAKTYSTDFLNELLLEYQFERVDFVYEPGQFSIRGGILDVFSFANEHHFRIEFFGDEVESIRTFDAASQLSIATHQFFNVVPNIQSGQSLEIQETFLGFIGSDTVCWVADVDRTFEVLKREYERAVELHSKH